MLRMLVSLCALLLNGTFAPASDTVCCRIERPFYEPQYEAVKPEYCSPSSNRLLGYGKREQVPVALCAPENATMVAEQISNASLSEFVVEEDHGFELVPPAPHTEWDAEWL